MTVNAKLTLEGDALGEFILHEAPFPGDQLMVGEIGLRVIRRTYFAKPKSKEWDPDFIDVELEVREL